ncbi:hypothetical protein TRAPUB_12753 [Trametes pubescens]|uniref:Heterokaryon incompatibility domain-containing protein n=1 Tax=Trametes pubescens TaxID=154538 RepID=A0A1M2VSY5_TRAPU|nr:hypothetical protein TRAPUB_12753 [Trametes pubescens]
MSRRTQPRPRCRFFARTLPSKGVYHPLRRRTRSLYGARGILPTRLVDCSNPDTPRLVFTAGQRGRYLALSYMWDEKQKHSTTTLNESTYCADEIDRSLLPQTIVDAICVTHALGLKFLWVDNLCIIQDSDQNQRHELGRVHVVYRHAYLAIIAASARKVSDGFLQDRPAAPALVLPFICPPPFFPRDGDSAARATTAHATTLQVGTTETRSIGEAFYCPHGERRLPDLLLLSNPPALQYGTAQWGVVHDEWLRVVEDYSQRGISHPLDKLVACGAIAQGFQRVLGAAYLAGLWRDTLLIDLLWRKAENEGAQLSRPAQYRAPSWSWVAVEGRVRMVDSVWPRARSRARGARDRAQVVRCDVVLEDAALPFGRVTGGSLVLRTASMACLLRPGGLYRRAERLISSEVQTPRGSVGDLDKEDDALDKIGRAYVDTEADAKMQSALWAVLLSCAASDPFKSPEGLLVTTLMWSREQRGVRQSIGEWGLFAWIGGTHSAKCHWKRSSWYEYSVDVHEHH